MKRLKIVFVLLVTLALILSVFGTAVPVMAADVALTKGVSPTTPNVYRLGDTIHYTMSITNISNLTGANEDVVVEAVWDVLPDGSTVYPTGPALPYTLTPGASQSYTYDWVATITGTVINTFYASGYQISTGGDDAFDHDVQKSSQVIDPAIHIEKSTNGQDADSPTGPYIAIGGLVTWEYVITNTGDSPLSNIIVTDSEGGVTPLYVSGDDGDNILQTTETWIYQAGGTAVAGQYSNTGYVTGTPLVGPDVSDDDPSHYFGSEACIHIEKSTNGQDADLPTGPVIPVGGVVNWEYVVTNCGDVPLSNVVVWDNNGTPGDPGDNWHPTFVGGDTSNFGVLDLTETWIYQAIGTALAGQYANNSRATGTPPVGPDVSDDDPSHYFGSAPAPDIHIEKHTNGVDADNPTGPYINIGNIVTWTYYVTNTGGVDLNSIVVTDNMPGVTPAYVSGDGGDLILQTTETWIYQATGTAVAGQYANIGTVRGYYGAVEVTDDDPSHYFGRTITIGWETYPINKLRVLLPWIALLAGMIVGASLLVLRHRRAQS